MRPLDLEKDKYPPMSKAERRALRQKRKREAMEGKAENGTSATPAAAAAPASSSTAPSSSTQAAPADTVDLSPSFQLDNDSVPPLSSLRDPSSLQELKLVIMSATLSAQKFSDYFASAPVLSIPGRTFPVDLLHSEEAQADYLDSAIVATLQVHLDWRETFPGDMLVFLTGSEEIETARKAIEEKVRRINEEDCPVAMQICTLYANLPSEQQLAVFEKPKENTRKVILSTNIAETSLTIPGIRYVIDTGVTKLRLFNPRTGGEVLKVVDVSQAEANQRSGRAGRDAPGVAYRLYTEESYAQLKPDLLPEILRSNLSSVVLQLKSLHVGNVLKFDFMTQPSRAALTRALEDLYTLRALTYNGSLSAMGRMMVHFPLPPAWARMLLVATEERFGCAVEIAKILAIMSVEGIFFASSAGAHKSSTAAEKQTIAQRKQFAHMEGDHFTYLDAFNAYLLHSSTHSSDLRARIEWCRSHHLNYKNLEKAKKILDQLAGLGQRLGLQWRSVNEKETGEEYGNCTQTDGIKQCLLHGLFHNVARKQAHDASYVTLNDSQTVYLHPSSVLIGRPKEKRPELLVFNTLVHTSRAYMRECMVLPDLKWLVELVPEAYAAGGVESANAAANGHSAGPLAAPTIKGGKQAHLLHERLASENSNQSKLSKVVEQARKKEAGGIGTTLKGTSHSKPSGSNSHQPHGGANRSKSDHQVKSEGGASTGSNRGGKATGAHTPVKSHHTSNGAAASSASTDKPQHREPRPPKEKKQNSKLKTKGDHLMDFINDL